MTRTRHMVNVLQEWGLLPLVPATGGMTPTKVSQSVTEISLHYATLNLI